MPKEIVETLSSEDYHKDKAIGKSGLDRIHKSINHFLTPRTKITPSLKIGSALHTSFLEAELFDILYMKEEKHDKRTKKGKEDDKDYQIRKKNKTVLTENEWNCVKEMHESLRNDPLVTNLFVDGKPEISLFWDEKDIRCKARPDWVIDNGRILVDLKTTQDASPEGFSKAIGIYRYHVQCAWYSRGATICYGKAPEQFVFVAVENVAPYNIGVYTLGLASRDEGWTQADADLSKYKRWLESPNDIHRGYEDKIIELEIPSWNFSY